MFAKCFSAAGIALMLGIQIATQTFPAAPIEMLRDRAADSYAIYSSLLPLDETDGPNPYKQFLVEAVTKNLIDPKKACDSDLSTSPFDVAASLNPHYGVAAPPKYRDDLREMLADFDSH